MVLLDPAYKSEDYRDAEISIILFQRVGSKLTGVRLEKQKDVANEVRASIAAFQLSLAESATYISWSPEAGDEVGEVFVADHDISHGHPKVTLAHGDFQSLIESVQDPSCFDVGDPSDLKSVYMYAFLASHGGHTDAFIRKANPRRYISSTRWFIDFTEPTLKVFKGDLLAFEDFFDFVVTSEKVYIHSPRAFELVFRDRESLEVQVPLLVEQLEDVLEMADESKSTLSGAAVKYVRQRKKLESILDRGHLARVDKATLRTRLAARVGDKIEEYLTTDGALIITPDNSHFMLAFLNEDYFAGELSEDQFEAERKRSAAAAEG